MRARPKPRRPTMTEPHQPVVLVGLDGSPGSRAALKWADEYANGMGGSLLVVSAWEEQWGTEGGLAYNAEFDRIESTNLATAALTDVLGADRASEVRFHVSHGNTAKVLIDASTDADLLVVGSRGHGGFAGALLGSVSRQVAGHAHCPVVVVHFT